MITVNSFLTPFIFCKFLFPKLIFKSLLCVCVESKGSSLVESLPHISLPGAIQGLPAAQCICFIFALLL